MIWDRVVIGFSKGRLYFHKRKFKKIQIATIPLLSALIKTSNLKENLSNSHLACQILPHDISIASLIHHCLKQNANIIATTIYFSIFILESELQTIFFTLVCTVRLQNLTLFGLYFVLYTNYIYYIYILYILYTNSYSTV